MKRFATTLTICLTLLALQGCMSYKVGSPNQPEFKTVYVKPVVNDSSFPLLESSLTTTTRKAINETGSIRSEDKDSADTFLSINISNLKREIAAIQSSDLGRGKKFELRMLISLSLYEDSTLLEPIFENRNFTISQDIFADSDLTQGNLTNQVDAEYQATPELSRKIAQRIAESLTENW